MLLDLLLKGGGQLLRMAGNAVGGRTAKVTSTVARVLDGVQGVSPGVARSKLEQTLAEMSPDDLVALRQVEATLAGIEADRERVRAEAETAQHTASQQTIRIEAQHGDEYVKHTRPRIARVSAVLGMGYILVMELGRLTGAFVDLPIPGADPAVAGTLLGPVGFYMTMRSVDAFSKKGKT